MTVAWFIGLTGAALLILAVVVLLHVRDFINTLDDADLTLDELWEEDDGR